MTAIAFVVVVPLMWRPFLLGSGWTGVTRRGVSHDLDTYVVSTAFRAGAVQRVLSGGDEKDDLYVVVRHGGVLDSELFPEGMHRQGFTDSAAYARLLRDRRIDTVVLTPGYATHFPSNEPQLLRELASSGQCVEGVQISRDGHRRIVGVVRRQVVLSTRTRALCQSGTPVTTATAVRR